MGRAERSVSCKKEKRKNVNDVLIKVLLKKPPTTPPSPSKSSWDVLKGPFPTKKKKERTLVSFLY